MDPLNLSNSDVSQNNDVTDLVMSHNQCDSVGGAPTSSNTIVGVVAAQERSHELNLTLDSLRSENLELEQTVKQLKSQLEQSVNESTQLKSDKDELVGQLESQREMIEQYKAQLVEMKNKFKDQLSGEPSNAPQPSEAEQMAAETNAPEPSEAGQIAAETNDTGSDHPSTFAIDDIDQTEKHLNALPDLPLRLIFSYLPLQDVLQMGRVCRFWQSYQSKIVSKVKSLTLLLGQPDLNVHFDYEHKQRMTKLVNDDGSSIYPVQPYDRKCYQVRYRLVRHDMIEFLLFTLPNISTLQIQINGLSYVALHDVYLLISLWSSKLTTFKLWCTFCEEDCHQLTNSVLFMLYRINLMTALKHLTLNIRHKLYPDTDEDDESPLDEQLLGVVPHFNLSVLSRLHEFSFSSNDLIEHTPLFYSLKHFVPSNPSLTNIAIHNGSWNNAIWPLSQRCSNGAARITSLTNVLWVDGVDLRLNPMAVQPILSAFSSLTELSYRHNPLVHGFIQLVNNFAPLRMLVRLHLILSFDLGTPEDLIYFSEDDDRAHTEISQLISVKMLSLEVITHQEHTEIESVHWGWTFPNVQVVEWFSEAREPVNFDVDHLAPTFLQLAQLRHIFVLDQEWTEWTVMETDGVKTIRRS